jgi:hypothetical protein
MNNILIECPNKEMFLALIPTFLGANFGWGCFSSNSFEAIKDSMTGQSFPCVLSISPNDRVWGISMSSANTLSLNEFFLKLPEILKGPKKKYTFVKDTGSVNFVEIYSSDLATEKKNDKTGKILAVFEGHVKQI